MFTIIPSSKIAQMVLLRQTWRLLELQIINILKNISRTMVQIKKKGHRNVPYDALYQNCTNGSALLNKRAARALDKKYL